MVSDSVDVFRIARLLIEDHGVFAGDAVKERIKSFSDAGDYNATKIWYEIEDALKEIESASQNERERVEAE